MTQTRTGRRGREGDQDQAERNLKLRGHGQEKPEVQLEVLIHSILQRTPRPRVAMCAALARAWHNLLRPPLNERGGRD